MPLKQQDRPYEVLVPHLGKDKFVLMSLDGSEYVSHTYSFRITMATEDKSIDDEDLLRKPILVTLRRQSTPARVIHGIIQKTKLLGQDNEQTPVYYWEATFVPWLWFLTLESDCRHFQNMDAVEIIKKVFSEHGYSDFTFKVQAKLPKREFTVQYRESSFNFISRLLEEEGIFYWFEHSESKHNLILTDQNSATRNCPHEYKFPYAKGTLSGAAGGVLDHLEQDVEIYTGKMTFQDFNFEKSSVDLTASTKGKVKAEIYDYPGLYNNKADGERYAKLRLEEQEARLRIIQAHTITTLLMPGYRFEVENHFDAKANTSYIVLGLSFSCRQNIVGNEAGDDGSTASFNVSAIPYKVAYRPPRRHPKPMIHGIQTAIVCGPKGNEIYCDKYGRVKVQFHWDRLGKRDENSSFWIRSSNAWSGGQWGQISIPRIGQEVIVSFLEGDPDRPIITGRVYNDQQMPPYGLPDNQTQSGIKSRSTPKGGSDDFNEFRFEDKKGSEQIYLHAQKDFDEYIENKHTITVRDSDQITLLNKGNQKTTVETGNRDITVSKGNSSNVISMGNHKLECSAGKISEKAAQEIKMECGASSITLTPTKIELKIGASTITMQPTMIDLKAAAASTSMGPATMSLTAPMIKIN
ncbi:type VI secretion system Vgr family protein [Bryobacter aggregatus]|uniref:type VI secretion system Vgr family protein n=1 Tax=Bryobacter aggregatus TaxID=360054 RepID=UPI00068AEF3B|nr:type VI secretion system tip protein TssI/VgrG [Bryobacter aggregatus]